jgi:hypothetical protein
MPRPEFERMLAQGSLHVAVPTSPAAFLEGRMSLLQQMLDQTDALARCGQLPDVELSSAGLKISPLENSVPREADALKETLYGMLPHVKITDLLMEVDRWTGFTRHFVHLKTLDPAKDPILLLTAILADATNLGLGKMAESCPGTSLAKLSWLVAWHIRDDTYSKALAEIVNCHHQVPFAAHWGEGTTSSSDGQRYRAGGRGEATGQVNLKYGNDPGVTFYTHVSDQWRPFIPRSSTPRCGMQRMFSMAAVSRVRSADRGALYRHGRFHRSRLRSVPPARLPLRAAHPRFG